MRLRTLVIGGTIITAAAGLYVLHRRMHEECLCSGNGKHHPDEAEEALKAARKTPRPRARTSRASTAKRPHSRRRRQRPSA